MDSTTSLMTMPAAGATAALISTQSRDDRPTKIRKLAALLIVLGPDLAAEILKPFEQRDIKDIGAEMAKMEMVDLKTQRQILKEFSLIAADAVTSATGGSQFTRQVLEKSIGSFQANELLQKILPSRTPGLDVNILHQMDAPQLFNLINREDPQVVAFILSYLDPMKCGEVLNMFNSETRCDVLMRVAQLEPVPSDVLGKVLQTLGKQIGATRALSTKSGGLRSVADVINGMEPALGRSLMEALSEKNPELAASIRKMLFTFEDLRKLDIVSLQKVLREVESRDLVLVMKTASETLRQSLLSALPKRAAENIKEESKLMGSVRLLDIELAQERILEAMRKLEAENEIVVGGGGKSEMVA